MRRNPSRSESLNNCRQSAHFAILKEYKCLTVNERMKRVQIHTTTWSHFLFLKKKNDTTFNDLGREWPFKGHVIISPFCVFFEILLCLNSIRRGKQLISEIVAALEQSSTSSRCDPNGAVRGDVAAAARGH